MIITTKPLKTKLKETNNPLEDFRQINTESNIHVKEVIFVRYIGIDSSIKIYIDNLLNIDQFFSKTSLTSYIRLSRLEIISNIDEIRRLSSIWDDWQTTVDESHDPHSLMKAFLCTPLDSDTLEWTKKSAFKQVLLLYQETHPNFNQTSLKNFVVKFLNWIEVYLPKLFKPNINTRISPKVMFVGDIKHHELLFLYFLSRLGCDICYMNPKEDILNLYPEIERYSTLFKCSTLYPADIIIPEYSPAQNIQPPAQVSLSLPGTKEYSYEQLAGLSNSVVMIKVYDNHENHHIISYGSGVVINSSGYILTNLHVVTGGSLFSVIFENETKEYITSDLIKYHQEFDLAIIRVDKNCSPLTVKTEGDLVRGQKIVAIGSPLGLFNSISDGIVSGFRDINGIKMIQFTAPISNGSSGGALLDMFGRLVGLNTAGFDKGQNINLAVPFQIITEFATNFIE